jgi:hypothetical protein
LLQAEEDSEVLRVAHFKLRAESKRQITNLEVALAQSSLQNNKLLTQNAEYNSRIMELEKDLTQLKEDKNKYILLLEALLVCTAYNAKAAAAQAQERERELQARLYRTEVLIPSLVSSVSPLYFSPLPDANISLEIVELKLWESANKATQVLEPPQELLQTTDNQREHCVDKGVCT